jgi:eight-cysteine-cluster-containing protein
MKKIFILFVIFLLLPLALALEPFCGTSTFASCSSDSDCQKGGCSGQVCGRKGEEIVTSCEWKECYAAENYNLSCQCINNKCQWGYENRTPFKSITTSTSTPSITITVKGVYNSLTSLNPLILLIFGIILILVAKLAKFIGIILIIFALIYLFLVFLK